MARPLILHPTDLGPISAGAFRHALRIALAERASLRLVHVHSSAGGAAAPIDAFPHVRETLARWGALPAGAPSTAVGELGLHVSKAEVVAARPEPGLEVLVDDEAPDLIVLGTRGQGEHDAQASFAETLARHVRTPALIVPAGAPGFVGEADGAVSLTSILLSMNDLPDPAQALAMVARLARALGAEPRLTLLHVGSEETAPRPEPPENTTCELMVRQAPIADAIVAAADETAADLIVMASEHRSRLPDDVRGDSTEHVLRRAHRPLLVVPVA